MDSPSRDPGTTPTASSEAAPGNQASGQSNRTAPSGGDRQSAAQGPIPEAVPVTDKPLPAPPADSPAEAEGRRTLSTAFVNVGPDGRLAVQLRDGRLLVLRDVVMRRQDYCGVQVSGDAPGARYCGGYAEVAAARPGSAPGR